MRRCATAASMPAKPAVCRCARHCRAKAQQSIDPSSHCFRCLNCMHVAFPYFDHPPTGATQFDLVLDIPRLISSELCEPVFGASLRSRPAGPIVMMLKASVYKKHDTMSTKNQVWRARQATITQAESQAQAMGKRTHEFLRFCVSLADARHHSAANLRNHCIHRISRLGAISKPTTLIQRVRSEHAHHRQRDSAAKGQRYSVSDLARY